MPFITVKVPAGVFGDTAKTALTSGICAAAAECEQVPDDPKMRALCVVTIEEIGAGNRTYGGRDLSQMLVSVDAAVNMPKGILDDRSRARFVELLHQAVVDALPGEHEMRRDRGMRDVQPVQPDALHAHWETTFTLRWAVPAAP